MTRPATRRATRRATLIGATAILLWGALAALTVLSGDAPPFQLLAMAFTIGTAVGLVAGGGRAAWPRLPGRVWALGIYGLFGYHFAYFMALRLAPPVVASLINYLWPVLLVLFAALLPGERLRGRHVAGAAAGFAGAALLVTGGGGLRLDSRYLPGYAFALVCAVIWSSYSVLSRRLATPAPAAEDDPPGGADVGIEGPAAAEETPLRPTAPAPPRRASPVTAYCAATAALALVCHLLFETTVWPAGWQWAAVVALGLGPVGAAFYTWDYGVKHGNIQTLGALAYAAPLLSTALLIALGLAEPSWALAAACALIVGGAVVASR